MSKFFKSMFLLLTAGLFTATGWAQEIWTSVRLPSAVNSPASKNGFAEQMGSDASGSPGSASYAVGVLRKYLTARAGSVTVGYNGNRNTDGNGVNSNAVGEEGYWSGDSISLWGRTGAGGMSAVVVVPTASVDPGTKIKQLRVTATVKSSTVSVDNASDVPSPTTTTIGTCSVGIGLASYSDGAYSYIKTSSADGNGTFTATITFDEAVTWSAEGENPDKIILALTAPAAPWKNIYVIGDVVVSYLTKENYSTRTLLGEDNLWTNATAWSNTTVPSEGSTVELLVSGAARLTMNAEASIGELTINDAADGENALTIAKTDSNKLTAITTIINADTTVNAGAASLGTVTIAADKTLTVKEGVALASLSGSGTLNLDLGTATTLTNYALNTFSGKTKISSGTLKYTAAANRPAGAILVSGENAALQIATNTDILGYSGGLPEITIENGGRFEAFRRDTFSRVLTLNNGKLVFGADNQESSRSFDLYNNSKIVSSGTSTIGGKNATNDAESNDPIVASGIIAIRRRNLEIEVTDGTLSVYSAIKTEDNSGGSVYKKGAGTLAMYRAATSALPVVVEAGELRLVRKGSLTTGVMTVNANAKLAYVGTQAPTNTLTNNGTIVADGTGTVVNLTDTPISGSGTYAVTDGATLILKKAQAEAGVTVAADAKLKVKVDSYEAVTLNRVTLDGGNNVVFVLPTGEEVIGTGATMLEQTHYTYTATAGEGNNWSTVANWKLNGSAVDAAPSGTVETPVEVVLTGATTLTMDVAGVTLSALSVSGGGDLTIAGENALTVKTVATANKVVVSGALILDAPGTEAAPTEMANVFEVAAGGTLTTKGYLNLTAANRVNSGGALEVASDVTTFNAAEQGIKGMLTIDKEATFKNGTNDALAYGTDGVVVDVYGTLDMGATRWTIFANNNTINLYAGAIVQGAGQTGHGALDIWENNSSTPAINVKKNESDTTPVQLMAAVRCRDGKAVVKLEKGIEATWSGSQTGINNNDGGLKVDGEGMLNLTGTNTYTGGTEIAAGATLMVNQFGNLGSSGAINVLGNLKFSTTSGSVNNQDQNAWGRLTGTGTVTFENCNSWYAICSIATTLDVVNNNRDSDAQSGNDRAGLVVTHDATIGTLSGDGWFRSDLQSTNRTLTIVQSEDSEFSGYFKSYADSNHRKLDVVVQSDNATPKTLTLSGNSIHGSAVADVNTLTIDDTGSVKLDGGWQGNVVAKGRLAGNGSIGGTLTFEDDSTLDVTGATEGALRVSGTVTLPSALTVKITEDQDVAGSVTLLNATEAPIPGGMAVTVMVGETVGENLYAVTHEGDAVKLTVEEHPVVTAMVSAGDTSLSEALNGAELAAHTILTIDFGDKGDSEAQPGTFTFNNTDAVSFAKIIVKGTNGGKITKTGGTVTTASLTVNTSATLANGAVAATDKVTIAAGCVLTYNVGDNITVNATHTGSGSIAVTSAGVVGGGKLEITKTCEVDVEVNSSASLVVNVDPAFDGDTFTKALKDNVTVSGDGSVFLQQGIAYAKFTVSHVEVKGTYYLGIGGTAEAPVGSFTPASLTVGEGAALKVRAYRGYALTVNTVHVNVKGSIARDGGTVEPTVTIANGKTLSGEGTINVPVTFEEGGLLDVSKGALGVSSVTGTVTLTGDMAAVQPVLYTTQGGVTFADIPGYKVPWVQSCYYWLVKDTAKDLSAVAPVGESPTAWSALPWQSSDGQDVDPRIFALGLDLTANVSAAADGAYVALNMPATYYAKTDLTLSGNFSPILYENSDSTAGNFKSLTVTGSAMVETALLNHVTGDVTVSGVLYPADAKDLFSEINETVAVTKPLKGSGVIVVNDGFTVTLEGALGADGTFGGQLYVGENGSLTLAQSAAQELSGAVEGPGAVLINAPITLTGRLGTVPELAAEAVYSGTLEILSAGSLCFASPTPTKVTGTLRSVKDSAHKLTVGDGTTASVLTVTGTMGTTVAPAEAEAVATTSTYAGYLTVAANSELHLQPTLATTLSASVTGAGKVVIGDGTSATKVTQTAVGCNISAIDIADGATYTVSAMKSGIVTLPATTTVTIVEGGKLQVQVATACQMNANVTGAGEVEVTSAATYVFADGPENCLAPGKLTLKRGLTLQANRAGAGLSVNALVFAGGAITSTSSNEFAKPVVTVANGQELSGYGAIAAPIVFEAGAIFDAKDSAVGSSLKLTNKDKEGNENTTITWPKNGGKVTVRATEPVQLILFAAAGQSEHFTLEDSAITQGLYLSEAKGSFGTDLTMSVLKRLGTEFLPTEVSGNATMKTAIQGQIEALAGKGVIITQVTTLKTQNTAEEAMGSAQAVNCFTNLEPTLVLTPNWNGGGGYSTTATATVTYDFGVADMTIKSLKLEGNDPAKMYVLLAAKVQNSVSNNTADFASGTELTVLNGEKEIIPTSVTAAQAGAVAETGVRWLAVPLKTLFPDDNSLGTRSLKVKAKNTTTTP